MAPLQRENPATPASRDSSSEAAKMVSAIKEGGNFTSARKETKNGTSKEGANPAARGNASTKSVPPSRDHDNTFALSGTASRGSTTAAAKDNLAVRASRRTAPPESRNTPQTTRSLSSTPFSSSPLPQSATSSSGARKKSSLFIVQDASDENPHSPSQSESEAPMNHPRSAFADHDNADPGNSAKEAAAEGGVPDVVMAFPRRRGRTPAITPVDSSLDRGDGDIGNARPGKRQRTNTPTKHIPLAKTADTMSEPDQMLVTMRDKGHEWPDIQKEWTKMTGQSVARSTLPNRYVRLRAVIDGFSGADDNLLVNMKNEVEDAFESEKWRIVQERVEAKLGRKLPEKFCATRFKQIMAGEAEANRSSTAATPASRFRYAEKAPDEGFHAATSLTSGEGNSSDVDMDG